MYWKKARLNTKRLIREYQDVGNHLNAAFFGKIVLYNERERMFNEIAFDKSRVCVLEHFFFF